MATSKNNIAELPFDRRLTPYACDWRRSKGRDIPEPASANRTPFQRDRDRIIHSDAFRRLQYKTQVYCNLQYGDHFRTRLTHSLEVAQLTRTVCRALSINEDLGEGVALAHDLGHPPFGHAGEYALDDCMKEFGGFWHNEHTLRLVRELEISYAGHNGLNLTWDMLEGIANHNGPLKKERITKVFEDLEPHKWCSLEGQVAAMCDDIAYHHHDMEDGLNAGNLRLDELLELPWVKKAYQEVQAVYPTADAHRQFKEIRRILIGRQIKNLLDTTRANLKKFAPQSVEDVRNHSEAMVNFSESMQKENEQLKNFLFDKMYHHHEQNRMNFRGRRIITDLFEAYFEHRRMLPERVQALLPQDKSDLSGKAQVVVDYICTLTDRSAVREHGLLFGSQHGPDF